MAIDPDVTDYVDPILADLQRQITELGAGIVGPPGPPGPEGPQGEPGSGSSNIPLLTPGATAADFNGIGKDLWLRKNGGKIQVDMENVLWKTDRTLEVWPGVEYEAIGVPMPYQDCRTRVAPQGMFPAFRVKDGYGTNKRQPWGASLLRNFGIDVDRPGCTALHQEGGNRFKVENFWASKGSHDLETFILIDPRRTNDGQYAIFDNVGCTRAHNPLEIVKNSPDTRFYNAMFYGSRKAGGRGVNLHRGVNNVKFMLCDVQFNWLGWDINGNATLVFGGSWENRSDTKHFVPDGQGGWNVATGRWATAAVRLGPTALDTNFISHDFANFGSLINRRVFDLSSQARKSTFAWLTGHAGPSNVPAGFEDSFTWAA